MPIQGIMSRGLRFPRLGSIRKGEQIPVERDGKPLKKNGELVMRPIERPWFVFSADVLGSQYIPEFDRMSRKEQKQAQIEHQEIEYKLQHELLEKIYSFYGTDQITELNVFLPYPSAHDAYSFWLEAYVANQKVAQSDESIVTFLFDTLTGEVLIKRGMVVRHSSNKNSVAGSLVKDIPIGGVLPYEKDMIIGETRTKSEPVRFRPVGRLNVIIPELKQAATWMVFTGAWSDIANIYSAVELIDQISKYTGQPANTVPLILRRVPREMSYEDENGKTKKTTKHFIEAKVVSESVKGLLTMYENTPFQMQLMAGDDEEEFFIPEEAAEYQESEIIAESEELPSEISDEDRPYSPEKLKEAIQGYAKYHKQKGTSFPENSPRILAKHLNEIFGNDTDRYTFTAWLFPGRGSTKKLASSEILAVLDWMEVEQFGDLRNEYADREGRIALEYINRKKGQKELPAG